MNLHKNMSVHGQLNSFFFFEKVNFLILKCMYLCIMYYVLCICVLWNNSKRSSEIPQNKSIRPMPTRQNPIQTNAFFHVGFPCVDFFHVSFCRAFVHVGFYSCELLSMWIVGFVRVCFYLCGHYVHINRKFKKLIQRVLFH